MLGAKNYSSLLEILILPPMFCPLNCAACGGITTAPPPNADSFHPSLDLPSALYWLGRERWGPVRTAFINLLCFTSLRIECSKSGFHKSREIFVLMASKNPFSHSVIFSFVYFMLGPFAVNISLRLSFNSFLFHNQGRPYETLP